MQHVAEYGQGYVQGNPGLLAGSGQGCEPGCLCEANIILLGVFGVRHILLHLPPPSLLVLKTLRIKTLNIHLQQTPAESTCMHSDIFLIKSIFSPYTGTYHI